MFSVRLFCDPGPRGGKPGVKQVYVNRLVGSIYSVGYFFFVVWRFFV